MKITLRYGRGGLDVRLPDKCEVSVFRTGEMPVIADPQGHVREAIKKPVSSPPLRELASGRQTACIVVSDITRPVPNAILLPPILEALESAGICSERIRILIATGIHRASTPEELKEMLGEGILSGYPITMHDSRNPCEIKRIGYTRRGTPIDINRLYVESELKIVTGLVEPHFMAGYSGGGKSVAVGLTSVDAIRHLHGPALLEHPNARNCVLSGNPLQEELIEMAVRAGVDFCVNVVLDSARRIGGVFCGNLIEAHRGACDFASRFCTLSVNRPFDIVLTTAGGYPLDTTYYQAVKGLVGALELVMPGGLIVLAAECCDGLGSDEFRQVLGKLGECATYAQFLEEISRPDNFVIDQWEVEMLVKALKRNKVSLFSAGISQAEWPLTRAQRLESLEDGLSLAITSIRKPCRLAVIPEGPYVIPRVQASETS
ncbi:MAG: nickel-dependent lactate racemase [Candidatus Abyssubacteria bacterium]